MPRTVTLFKVFVASSADASDARERVARVVDAINQEIGAELDLRLELRLWETHLSGNALKEPQAAIDSGLSKDDILVGILRHRTGAPLSSEFGSRSGTEYEIAQGIESFKRIGTPRVLLYISNEPIEADSLDDLASLDQMKRLVEFKETLKSGSMLFSEFGSLDEFSRKIHQDITRLLADYATGHQASALTGVSVFISYAREDSDLVGRIANQLAVEGVRAWYDTSGLTGGDDWVKRIADEIEKCDAVLLVASSTALASRWVRRELEFADKHGKAIIPVEHSHVDWPNWFDLQFGGVHRLALQSALHKSDVQNLLAAIHKAVPH
jgi:hypothetical protein